MTGHLRILILEDRTLEAQLVERELRRSKIDFTARYAGSKQDYLKGLEEFVPDVILSDYSLPDFDGMQALRLAQEHAAHVPFIIVTGTINEETAVECMKAGAVDYVLKEHIGRIAAAIQFALEKKHAESKLRESEELLRLITDNVTDLIAILDLQGKRLYNSASYGEILGNPQSLRGTSSFKEIHPDDVATIKRRSEERRVGKARECRWVGE